MKSTRMKSTVVKLKIQLKIATERIHMEVYTKMRIHMVPILMYENIIYHIFYLDYEAEPLLRHPVGEQG